MSQFISRWLRLCKIYFSDFFLFNYFDFITKRTFRMTENKPPIFVSNGKVIILLLKYFFKYYSLKNYRSHVRIFLLRVWPRSFTAPTLPYHSGSIHDERKFQRILVEMRRRKCPDFARRIPRVCHRWILSGF